MKNFERKRIIVLSTLSKRFSLKGKFKNTDSCYLQKCIGNQIESSALSTGLKYIRLREKVLYYLC